MGQCFKSNNCGTFEVVEYVDTVYKCDRYRIRFLETGFETVSYITNIRRGEITDKKKKNDYSTGKVIINDFGQKALVLSTAKQHRRKILYIEFITTGYKTQCTSDNFRRGKTKDYLLPTVCGVGKLGYINIQDLKSSPEYTIWSGMIERCHTGNKGLSYEDKFVCERWKRFDYFLEDLPKIENYMLWKEHKNKNPNKINIYELDKDTKYSDNKEYSLENCRFVHMKHNRGFTTWAKEGAKNRILKEIDLYEENRNE